MPLTIVDSADLSALNSFGVAARAQQLITLDHERDIGDALTHFQRAERRLLLGAGSNLLFTSDFHGTVLKVSLNGRAIVGPADPCAGDAGPGVLVEAAAGEGWHDFVMWTLSQGLYGLENLALIPGSVGAAPVQNIGAYGVEMCEFLHTVRAVSLVTGEPREFSRAECGFGYRESCFRRTQGHSEWLILSVRFRLLSKPQPRFDYPDLRARFASSSPAPTPEQIAHAVCAIRQRKLPNPAELGNAGSFFRNPITTAEQALQLAKAHPAMPRYPDRNQPGLVKIPAAWLIDQCGWKGYRRGDAGVHDQHALVLVNHGHASGTELLALAHDIRASVAERFNLVLEPEVVMV
jgi:UDP-N-acetylmuramate dehydrogenase